MEPQDHEERFRQHEAIMAGPARMLEAQHMMKQRMDAFVARMDAFVAQQVEINLDVRTTPARIETLLACMIPLSENGREASPGRSRRL
jgi:hypothetical protein